MNLLHDVSYFFGGLILINAVPHFVSGMMGRPFQSPFAKPHGRGLSSSLVNICWAWFNLALGYGLVFGVGHFDIRQGDQVAAFALGAFAISVFSAVHFGRFNGGNRSTCGGEDGRSSRVEAP